MPRVDNPNVLVGFETADDAGVYRLSADLALVQTVDFFTPIVDDPFTFGAIAAANSLSDVYAMGGSRFPASRSWLIRPTAIPDLLEEILRGGFEKMREAGCAVLGGHSVTDPEIKFGYAVTGTIHPDRIKANSGARPGDALVFTKAHRDGGDRHGAQTRHCGQRAVEASVASMLTLNRAACEAMLRVRRARVHGRQRVRAVWAMRAKWRWPAMSRSKSRPRACGCFRGRWMRSRAGAIPGGLRNNRDFVSCASSGSGQPSIPRCSNCSTIRRHRAGC